MKPETITAVKYHGFNISVSTVATLIPVFALGWLFVKPALLVSISEAVADDVNEQVEQEIAPLNAAFKILLRIDIYELTKAIARLENKREFHPETWSDDDSEALANYKIKLSALEEAEEEL